MRNFEETPAGKPIKLSKRTFLSGAAAVALAASLPRRARASSGVSLGWVKSTTNIAAFLAPSYSEKNGLTIESSNFNNAVDIATAMVSGDLDIGLLTPIHLVRAIESNIDFVQICGNSRVDSTIVAAPKLGLKADDWAAFKAMTGQRKLKVASSRASINDLLAIARVAKNGIDPDKDLEISNIPSFAQHPQALRSGEFDMIFTIEPMASMSVIEGVGSIFARVNELDSGPVKTIYVVRRDWLEKNKDKAEAFVKTLSDVMGVLSKDKELELKSGLKFTGLKPDVLEMAVSINQYDLRNGLPQLAEVAAIAAQRRYTERDVSADVKKHVDDAFTKAIGITE
ncbi:MAG: ABC transporter substrate-binding protein [Parvibaculaceae bacterium]